MLPPKDAATAISLPPERYQLTKPRENVNTISCEASAVTARRVRPTREIGRRDRRVAGDEANGSSETRCATSEGRIVPAVYRVLRTEYRTLVVL
jgi:hypothetical protein